jgi:hypothetical protein
MIFNEGIYGDQNKKYEHDKMKLFQTGMSAATIY